MSPNRQSYQTALQDFNDARIKASMQEVLARLTGKSNELLSYEEVAQKLKLNARSERGVHEIPLNAIVGSVGRYTDFSRSFLPLKRNDKERWARVKAVIDDPTGTGLPPIEVYKVGEVYFVLDGNHRVSIARREGFEFIEAHIIEVQTNIPITPDIQPDDLIIKAEYAEFLDQTGIATLLPNVDLSVTVPGQYEKLKEHIEVHRYFRGIELQQEIPYEMAVKHWYETVYLSLAEAIRERGLLRWFPERTVTDLYLWVSEHRAALENETGWSVSPEAIVTDLANKESAEAENQHHQTGSWRKDRMFDRYTDHLFKDILVPLGREPEDWQGFEQALTFARHEEAILHGLHIVSAKAKIKSSETVELQDKFNQRCAEAGVTGTLVVESGNINQKICERALLTDLVILNVLHAPAPGLSSLGSGLRSIIWRSPRPILTLKSEISGMKRALLAFDGSTKAKEALFVAAYLGEQWKTALTVLTVSDGSKSTNAVQDIARNYLEFHELEADYILTNGPMENSLNTIEEHEIDLVLLGGYSGTVFKEIVIGSTVNFLLREAKCPLFICH